MKMETNGLSPAKPEIGWHPDNTFHTFFATQFGCPSATILRSLKSICSIVTVVAYVHCINFNVLLCFFCFFCSAFHNRLTARLGLAA